jgi:4-azaleucine resistance transporter AzlC
LAGPAIRRDTTHSAAGLLAGMRRSLPLAVSDAAYGVVFGVLARQAGLSLPEATLMSALVYAGSAQFVALGLWAGAVPVISLGLSTLLVNLRYLLMGSTMAPRLADVPPLRKYASLFLLTDESWALSLAEFERGKGCYGFLVGSGLLLYCAWVGGTVAGRLAGALVPNPSTLGLDFAFTALFAALLAGRYRGRRDLTPWAVAGCTALVTAAWIPGMWYVLTGAVAGSLVGEWRDAD